MCKKDKMAYDVDIRGFAKIPDVSEMIVDFRFPKRCYGSKQRFGQAEFWAQRLIELGIMQAARLSRSGHPEWVPILRDSAEAGAKPAGGENE